MRAEGSQAPRVPRRVVICSAHYWGSAIQVSAHHYARLFSRDGAKVLFLSTPVTPFHAIATPRSLDHRRRFVAWWERGRADRASGVTQFMPMTVLPLSSVVGLRFPWALRNWWRYTVPSLSRELRELGFFRPDLAIVDSALGAFIPDLLAPGVTVYRMTDYNAGFASSTAQLADLEEELARRADIVAVTAAELVPRAQLMAPHKKILHLPHGVDLPHFAAPGAVPEDMKFITRPLAIYVGSLREWFDYDLVSWLAEQLPEMSFVLIGPDRAARGMLSERPNIHLLGERPYSAVPSYLTAADVGIIPFDREKYPSLVDHANPLKLYEYMAAGLPVVSTDWPVLRRLGSPALLSRTRSEYRDNLLIAIDEAPSLGPKGEQFARDHGWEASYQKLLAAVGPLLRA